MTSSLSSSSSVGSIGSSPSSSSSPASAKKSPGSSPSSSCSSSSSSPVGELRSPGGVFQLGMIAPPTPPRPIPLRPTPPQYPPPPTSIAPVKRTDFAHVILHTSSPHLFGQLSSPFVFDGRKLYLINCADRFPNGMETLAIDLVLGLLYEQRDIAIESGSLLKGNPKRSELIARYDEMMKRMENFGSIFKAYAEYSK